MRRTLALALALAGSLAAPAAPAASLGTFGAQYRYWSFSNGNDLRDPLVTWVPGPVHVQLEYWDFLQGEDSFRPEAGLHLRDRRRSVYTVQWRHERLQERWWAGTDQVLNDYVVGRVQAGALVARDSAARAVNGGRLSWVWEAGVDVYWGSYSFASYGVIRDPREGGLWIVPMRGRLATEKNDWIQLTVAPASRKSLGWAVDLKARWLRAGVERNNRFDFTNTDNTIVTAGVEIPLDRR